MKRTVARGLEWLAISVTVASVGVAAAALPRGLTTDAWLPVVERPEAAAAPLSIDTILELSPFGRAVRTAAPIAALATTTGLTLHGVVIAARPEASSAIVAGASEPARVYRIGDAITESAALDAVFSDHVLLRVSGNFETLSFPKPEAITPAVEAATDGGVDALRAMLAEGDNAPAEP